MNTEMKYKQKRTLIIAQIVGVLVGPTYALSTGGSVGSVLTKILIAPLAFAAAFRLSVRVYQFVRIGLAKKIYTEDGQICIIPRTLWGLIAGVIPLVVLSNCESILMATPWYGHIFIILVLALVDGLLFYLDLKYIWAHQADKTQDDNTPLQGEENRD